MVLQLEYQVHVGERREFVLPLEDLESGRVKGWLVKCGRVKEGGRVKGERVKRRD